MVARAGLRGGQRQTALPIWAFLGRTTIALYYAVPIFGYLAQQLALWNAHLSPCAILIQDVEPRFVAGTATVPRGQHGRPEHRASGIALNGVSTRVALHDRFAGPAIYLAGIGRVGIIGLP